MHRTRALRREGARAIRHLALPGRVALVPRLRLARVDTPRHVPGTVILLVVALLLQGCGATIPSPQPATPAAAASAQPAASPTPPPSPTATPTPEPLVAAPTDGVLESPADAARPVLAVMIDDAPAARPQSGLADADVIIQAPAEGGIPRYLALYQSRPAPSIGPIRSSRRYFLGWAAGWRPLYAHVGGAPNALAAIQSMNGASIWDADEYEYAAYMPRIATRFAPHNVYSSTKELDALAARLAVPPPSPTSWTFADSAPPDERPVGGTLVVPYPAGVIGYAYDATTNSYPRSVDGVPEIDAGTNTQVAPSNVVVMYVAVGPLANAPGASTNVAKGRLEVGYIGSGTALVLSNGIAVRARWSKASDEAPLLFSFSSGPDAGRPVPLVRGQVVIQVVPAGTSVTYRPGSLPAPSASPIPGASTTGGPGASAPAAATPAPAPS